MVHKAGYYRPQYNSNYQIRKAQRELEKHQEELRNAAAAQKKITYHETQSPGGVVVMTNQVQSCEPTKVKCPDGEEVNGYEITFNNGMTVTFADQTNKKIKNRRYDVVSTIFTRDTNIEISNVIVGNLKCTNKSENINLEVCYDFNVDGGGGEDTYTSRQKYDLSNNSYTMHPGDVYQKKSYGLFRIEEERYAETSKTFKLTDNTEHKEYLKELDKLNKEIKVIEELRKNKPPFEVEAIRPKPLDENFKEEVIKRSEESKKQFSNDGLLQTALDFVNKQISDKMMEEAVNLDSDLLKDVENNKKVEAEE